MSWKVTALATAADMEPGRKVELVVAAKDVALLPA